jgi:hypothetical protein
VEGGITIKKKKNIKISNARLTVVFVVYTLDLLVLDEKSSLLIH